MYVGILWIIVGFAITFASSVPGGDLTGESAIVASWHLNLIGVAGLLLASQGCRILQAGLHRRRAAPVRSVRPAVEPHDAMPAV
jgi:hypothetical protein